MNTPLRHSGMACILKGSHSFTGTPRVYPLMGWTIPAFAFPAEAGTHLPNPEGWKAELALVPCGCWPQPTVGCESFPRLLLSTLTICYYSACKLILVAVYQSIIRTCCHEVMLDPVSDTGSDRSELDFTRQKITYRDYIGLWTTLLHLTTVKACCSIVWCLSDDAQCNTGWADICTVATCDS